MATTQPDITVEIAFGDGFGTPIASMSWTDVTDYIEAKSPLSITRGRSDELSEVSPSVLTVTLDNSDGRFTPAYTSGAHYPDVKKGVPIRVIATWNGNDYDRFLGYVDEWPVEWPDASAEVSTVTINASSRQARLGRNAPLVSALQSTILADNPTGYWMLSEPSGSSQVFDLAGGNPLLMDGTGTSVEFGSATGPAFDGQTGALFAAGKYLTGTTPSLTTNDLTIECFVSTSTAAGTMHVVESQGVFELRIESGVPVFEAAASTATALSSIADGNVHHIAATTEDLGATLVARIYVDGVLHDQDTQIGNIAGVGDLVVGAMAFPPPPTGNLNAAVSHLAAFDSALSDSEIAVHAAAGLDGFEGESSDARIERLADMAGIPSAEVVTEAGMTTSMSGAGITGEAPVNALQAVARTEQGLVFDAADGTLVFHSRAHRYGASSTLTLDASLQRIEAGLTPKLDDLGLVNDLVVTASGYQTRASDAASLAGYGYYQQSVELLTTDAHQADDYANWQVGVYSDPQVRIGNAAVELATQASTSLLAALLAAEIGDRITISNLPSQAPASSMDFFVEGYTEQPGFQTWLMTFNLSPVYAELDNLWILEVSDDLGTDTVLGY